MTDVDRFRKEWTNNGPMGNTIQPDIAIERLGTLRDKLEIRERKVKSLPGIFALESKLRQANPPSSDERFLIKLLLYHLYQIVTL